MEKESRKKVEAKILSFQPGYGPEDVTEETMRNVAFIAANTTFIMDVIGPNLVDETGRLKEGVDWDKEIQEFNNRQIDSEVELDGSPISWPDISLVDVIKRLRSTRFPDEARERDLKTAEVLENYLNSKKS